MNAKLIVVLSLGAMMANQVQAVKSKNGPIEDRPIAEVRDTYGASEWWASTWRTGDRLRMETKYELEGQLKVDNKEELHWYDYTAPFWATWKLAKNFIEADHKVGIEGVVKTQTIVLYGCGPHGEPLSKDQSVQLIRTYECPMSSRCAAVIGLKGGLEADRAVSEGYIAFHKIMNAPEMKELIDERWDAATDWAVGLAHTGLGCLAAIPKIGWVAQCGQPFVSPVVRAGSRNLKSFLEKTAQDKYDATLKRITGDEFKNGGVEAKANSPFYVNYNSSHVSNAVNFATQVNDIFKGKTFYLASAIGDTPFGRELSSGGAAYKCFDRFSHDFQKLPEKMYALRVSNNDAKASGVFTRETLNVNARLFDATERHVGDKWRVDASLLNNFLHPDLKGAFSGTIQMEFVRDDEPITLETAGENETKRFLTRHLAMLTKKGCGTYLQYSEGDGFCISYDADDENAESKLDVYVDKESGYVIKVDFKGKGNVKMLPDLYLAHGWGFNNGEGMLRMSLKSEAVPTRCLEFRK